MSPQFFFPAPSFCSAKTYTKNAKFFQSEKDSPFFRKELQAAVPSFDFVDFRLRLQLAAPFPQTGQVRTGCTFFFTTSASSNLTEDTPSEQEDIRNRQNAPAPPKFFLLLNAGRGGVSSFRLPGTFIFLSVKTQNQRWREPAGNRQNPAGFGAPLATGTVCVYAKMGIVGKMVAEACQLFNSKLSWATNSNCGFTRILSTVYASGCAN